MTITGITTSPFCIPFRRPLDLTGGTVAARRGLVVALCGPDQMVGLGEVSPHPAAQPDALVAAERAIAAAGASLIATGSTSLPVLLTEVAWVRPTVARASLEMALYDLAARMAGKRVADLLGPIHREAIPQNALLDEVNPHRAADAAREAVRAGFRCLKLKTNRQEIDRVVDRVAAVRTAVGDGVALRLDVNGGWTVGEAVNIIPQLTAHGIEYIEQPVTTIDELAIVRRAVRAPIAADECVTDVASVQRLARSEAADVVVVKPTLLGLTTAHSVIEAAQACRLGVVVTSALDTSIGISAALHIAATVAEPVHACGLATAPLLVGDLVSDPPRARDGYLRVPSTPGLGVELDPLALRRWAVGSFPPAADG